MIDLLWENFFRKETSSAKKILKESYIFQDLTSSELNKVSNFIHLRSYKAGEAIFRQGDLGIGMYVVSEGCVDIFIENQNNDKPAVIRLEPSDFMGETSLLQENAHRTATAIAHEDVQIIGFFKPDLDEIIKRSPDLGIKIIIRISKSLSRRLLETAKKVSDLKQEITHMDT